VRAGPVDLAFAGPGDHARLAGALERLRERLGQRMPDVSDTPGWRHA